MTATDYFGAIATIACVASLARLVIAFKAYRLAKEEVDSTTTTDTCQE